MSTSAGKATFVGLFFITLATLMYEILLTRIFSVTMWYHFAFVAVSLALFGMTVGAIVVYLLPRRFSPEATKPYLALSALLFSLTAVGSFLVHVYTPFSPALSLSGLGSVALTYTVLAIPFAFSGICVALALTRFPGRISRLYAADLAGAALGCVALIYTLRVTDGPTAVIVVAALAALGAALFAVEADRRRLLVAALVGTVALAGLAAVGTRRAAQGQPLLRLRWVKGRVEPPPLYEKWNSFSRITIHGDPNRESEPTGLGTSPSMPAGRYHVRNVSLTIDANAATSLTAFDGDVAKLGFFKYNLANLAHHLRPNASVLVIGAGGGRDLLSALAFGQRSVVGVEMNGDILNAVNGPFGDYTGHLDGNPKVKFVADEARSYVARQTERYDIIQVSLIDTWAATAAGAFVLAEQSLYTVEAWETFLEHLTDRGVLTFTRWYFRGYPSEMYRLTALAGTALHEYGAASPREHIMIVRRMAPPDAPRGWADGVGTMLVSKQPFSRADVEGMEKLASDLGFELVLSPRHAIDQTFATLATGKDLEGLLREMPVNVAPPRDDSPFFFHVLRLKDILKQELWDQSVVSFNAKAVVVLGALLVVVTVLTLVCIVAPLLLTRKAGDLRGALPLLLFFGSIGTGFMLVEISQMQRLIIFLGHPTYGLSVVLFSLLLSSSLGSYLTRSPQARGVPRLLALLAVLVAFGLLTPSAIQTFRAATTPVRVLVATGLLSVIGVFMGMAFPLGMRLAAERSASLTPWLWGVNGATSVCASVVAVAIALTWGITATFWVGGIAYVIALASFLWASRVPAAA